MMPLALATPKRVRDHLNGLDESAFFDPLPSDELDAWEIATKHRFDKLSGAQKAVDKFNELIQADGFTHLSVTYQHALKSDSFKLDPLSLTAPMEYLQHRDGFFRNTSCPVNLALPLSPWVVQKLLSASSESKRS